MKIEEIAEENIRLGKEASDKLKENEKTIESLEQKLKAFENIKKRNKHVQTDMGGPKLMRRFAKLNYSTSEEEDS